MQPKRVVELAGMAEHCDLTKHYRVDKAFVGTLESVAATSDK